MKVRVGQIGSRMYYGVPRALAANNLLEGLYTDFTINKGLPNLLSKFSFLLPKLNKLNNRHVFHIEKRKIHHLSDFGLKTFRNIQLAKDQRTKDLLFYNLGKQLENLILKDGLKGVDVITMIGSSSSTVFQQAKQQGIITVQEEIIAPSGIYKNIITSEIHDYAKWQTINISQQSIDFWQEISEKEWHYADHLICGSSFVKNAISQIGGPSEKAVVIPYGIPRLEKSLPFKSWDGKRKLRLLFVGAVGLRKGAHYLFQAAKLLHKDCEIRFCGKQEFDSNIIETYGKYIDIKGHVSRHSIGEHYEWADVFVLPSLFEGSATVGYEALQYFLPMIVTPNAGQMITNNEEGFVIEAKSVSAIVAAVQMYLNNPNLINIHSFNAKSLSDEASYDAYSKRLIDFFENKIK